MVIVVFQDMAKQLALVGAAVVAVWARVLLTSVIGADVDGKVCLLRGDMLAMRTREFADSAAGLFRVFGAVRVVDMAGQAAISVKSLPTALPVRAGDSCSGICR